MLFVDNAQRWQIALSSDLGRPAHETTLLELSPLIKHALTAYKKVGNWAKPDSVPFDLQTYPLGGKVLKEPKGTILIIGPFNYPIVSYKRQGEYRVIVLLNNHHVVVCCRTAGEHSFALAPENHILFTILPRRSNLDWSCRCRLCRGHKTQRNVPRDGCPTF